MPPKRNCGISSSQPQVKMIKIGSDPDEQMFASGSMEDRFGMEDESSPSPLPNNEHEPIDFDEENLSTTGIRTDTISLLMKIDQLQAQLKYERRCRILAERELRELREMNTLMMQMRHMTHELRVTLDQVLQGGEPPVTTQNPEETLTFLPGPEVQMRTVDNIPEDELNFLYLAENLRVPKNLYERVAEIGDYKKYVSALLMILFDRDTLATHCLLGRKNTFTGEESHKPPLPPEILKSLMDHVAEKFGVDSTQIKNAIRTKLNNEDKLMKKRLGLNRTESRVVVEQTFCRDAASLQTKTERNGSEF
uniref:BEN domain-containing protein n=1 Tax=Iconisemion striatum TaxID=60296 RepID=A0A1A7WAA9_9TELE